METIDLNQLDQTTLIFRRIVILLSLGTLTFGVIRSQNSWDTYQKLTKGRDVLKKHVTDLELETQNLSQEIERLKTSPIYAKKTLKDKYHETEQQEELILMQDPDPVIQ